MNVRHNNTVFSKLLKKHVAVFFNNLKIHLCYDGRLST
jgi:hypothetical protein